MLAAQLAGRWRPVCAVTLVCTLLAACSGGGGGSSPPAPVWGRFRHDSANSGVGFGFLAQNPGTTRWVFPLNTNEPADGVTDSTPVIGLNNTVYVGTRLGLLAVDREHPDQRNYRIKSCPGSLLFPIPSDSDINIGPINGAPAVTVNNDIVVGNDSGYVFAIHDDGNLLNCIWAFHNATDPENKSVRSSPIAVADPVDFRLTGVFIGMAAGRLQALNGNGTEQWRFQTSDLSLGPLSASPSSDASHFYITAPDGFLYAIDSTGAQRWRALVGTQQPETEETVLSSPAVGSAVYTVAPLETCDSSAACTPTRLSALNPDGSLRWQLTSVNGKPVQPVPGSPALAPRAIEELVPPTPSVTPAGTPTPTIAPAASPTPTATIVLPVVQDVLYFVDRDGTVYALRGTTGQPFMIPLPLATSTPTPTSTPGPAGVTPGATPPASKISIVHLPLEDANVVLSPALSADLFVVFATSNGRIYAINVDYDRSRPCTASCSIDNPEWKPAPSSEESDGDAGGFVELGSPPRSSPVVDQDGTIYVTTDDGQLHAINTVL